MLPAFFIASFGSAGARTETWTARHPLRLTHFLICTLCLAVSVAKQFARSHCTIFDSLEVLARLSAYLSHSAIIVVLESASVHHFY